MVLVPSVARGQFGIFGGGKTDYRPFADPGRRFQLEYPKDWTATAGVGDVLVTFAHRKGEAALVIEKLHLNEALSEITDAFGEFEARTLKERQPQATDVSTKILASNGRPVITIDYARPGLGGAERGRQYSFPIGQELYRLNCTSLASMFAKYDPVFLRIASSFGPAAPPSPDAPKPGAATRQ